jgi:hypothetical protein
MHGRIKKQNVSQIPQEPLTVDSKTEAMASSD